MTTQPNSDKVRAVAAQVESQQSSCPPHDYIKQGDGSQLCWKCGAEIPAKKP